MMIHAGRFETRWQAWKNCHYMVHGKRSRWTTAHLSRHRGIWDGKITEGPRSAADCWVWRLGGCLWAHKLQVCHDSPKNRSEEHTAAPDCSPSPHISPRSKGGTSISGCSPQCTVAHPSKKWTREKKIILKSLWDTPCELWLQIISD